MDDCRQGPMRTEEIERFREDGFILAGKVIDGATTVKLRDSLATLDAGPVGEGTFSMDLMRRDERNKDFSFQYLSFLWKTREEFRRVAFSPHLARMAAQLLGVERVVLFGDAAFLKHPENGGRLHWHQDSMAWPLDRPGGLTCWIALDEATPDNGSMTFARTSHLLGERLPVEATTGDTLYAGYGTGQKAGDTKGGDLSNSGMLPITSPAVEGLDEVATFYQPGEASFHDSLVWHASGYNTTKNFRRAYSIRYVDGNRLWAGEAKAFYWFKDEEAGVEVGQPVSGPHFPTVWPSTNDHQ